MIDAVIFDLDGTLGDTLPLCVKAFRLAIEPIAGTRLSDGEIAARFGPSEEGVVMSLIPDRYEEGIAAYLRHYGELLDQLCPAPFDGVPELLEFLKVRGLKLAIVSGKGEKSARVTLRKFGIDGCFDAMEFGDPGGERKEACIRSVMKKLGLRADETVYVGDAPADIVSSRAAGVRALSAAWGSMVDIGKLESLGPDAIFLSVGDLQNYIRAEMRADQVP